MSQAIPVGGAATVIFGDNHSIAFDTLQLMRMFWNNNTSRLEFNWNGGAIFTIDPSGNEVTTAGYFKANIDNGIQLASQTSGAAGFSGTLTNAPTAGDPAFWIKVQVNGVQRYIPAW